MRRIACILGSCLLLAGCAPAASVPAPAPAVVQQTATPEQTAETGKAKTRQLTVVLNGCIAYEADSAGGSLKTAIAAADLVVYLAGDSVPDDLPGETAAWQQDLDADDRATMDANWPGVYTCAQGICEDPAAQQGLLDDAGVTTDFAAMDLAAVPAQLDDMNEVLTDGQG